MGSFKHRLTVGVSSCQSEASTGRTFRCCLDFSSSLSKGTAGPAFTTLPPSSNQIMHLKRHSNLAVAIAIVLVLICTILSFIPDARAGFSNRAIATTRAGLVERIVSLSNDPTGGESNIDIHHIHSSSRNRVSCNLNSS